MVGSKIINIGHAQRAVAEKHCKEAKVRRGGKPNIKNKILGKKRS